MSDKVKPRHSRRPKGHQSYNNDYEFKRLPKNKNKKQRGNDWKRGFDLDGLD